MGIIQAFALTSLGAIIGYLACGLMTGNAVHQAQEILDQAQALIERLEDKS